MTKRAVSATRCRTVRSNVAAVRLVPGRERYTAQRLLINAHERDPNVYVRGMREALDLVAAGQLDPRPLMTHCFPLAELPRALGMSVQRPAGFLKALVVCNEPKPRVPRAD